MNLQCKKCEKVANNRASIELKNDTDRIKGFVGIVLIAVTKR